MTTTIRARGPRELLAYVPFRLGYRPDDSAVLVSLRTARGRVGLVARIDLSDLADLENGPQVARTLVSHLCSDGASRAALVVYSDADLRSGGAGAARNGRRSSTAGMPRKPFSATSRSGSSRRAATTRSTASTRCAARRRPPAQRPRVHRGRRAHGSRRRVGRCLPCPLLRDPGDGRRAPASGCPGGARWRARREGRSRRRAATPLRCGAARAWRHGGPRRRSSTDGTASTNRPGTVRWTVRGEPGAPAGAPGRLEAALESIPVRDAVLLSFVAGNDELSGLTASAVQGPQVDAGTASVIAAIVDPVAGRPPDEEMALRTRGPGSGRGRGAQGRQALR
ncbi:DUF4192 family protein [Oerskovia sp. M15]